MKRAAICLLLSLAACAHGGNGDSGGGSPDLSGTYFVDLAVTGYDCAPDEPTKNVLGWYSMGLTHRLTVHQEGQTVTASACAGGIRMPTGADCYSGPVMIDRVSSALIMDGEFPELLATVMERVQINCLDGAWTLGVEIRYSIEGATIGSPTTILGGSARWTSAECHGNCDIGPCLAHMSGVACTYVVPCTLTLQGSRTSCGAGCAPELACS